VTDDANQLVVDVSEWPLVVVRQAGAPSAEQLAAYLRGIEDVLARKEPYGMLALAGRTSSLVLRQRRALAQHLRAHSVDVAKYNVGVAFVFHSPITRALYAGLMAIFPQPSPHTVVATEAEARAWLEARFVAAGIVRGQGSASP
jgi:hypothetical protein